MADKTGGAAFPVAYSNEDFIQEGATLRDYFAAKAMQGVLANNQCTPMGMSFDPNSLSKMAYGMADAMLKARG